MRIIIVENTVHEKIVFNEGKRDNVYLEHKPTGRSWSVDIPIETVPIKEVWTDIKGDVVHLINQFRRATKGF